MYCGGCNSIPFWRWLNETQTSFLLAILLSVLRITASDYFFGIFRLFFIEKQVDVFNVYAINLIILSKVCRSSSVCGTYHATLVANSVISHE
jgi:hypothetical protein